MKKHLRAVILVLMVFVVGGATVAFVVLTNRGSYETTYNKALAESRKGEYKSALGLFERAASQKKEKTKNFYADYARAAYYAGETDLAQSLARRASETSRLDADRSSIGQVNLTIENILDESLPSQLDSTKQQPVERGDVDGLIAG